MDKSITMGFPEAEEEDILLPEGWTADVDIFDESYSGGLSPAADELPGEGSAPGGQAAESPQPESAFTTGGDPADGAEIPDGTGSAPTTGRDPAAPNKLKFSAVVDHEKRDVELEESELPALYQKAQVTDRVQSRLREIGPAYAKVRDAARELGYDSVEDMLQSFRGGRRAAAQDMEEGRDGRPPKRTERDLGAEMQALVEQFPGARQVPDEVFAISSAQGKGNTTKFVADIKMLLAQNKIDEAMNRCRQQKGSVASVVYNTLVKYKELDANKTLSKEQKLTTLRNEVEEATALEMPSLSQNLPIIATLTTLGTLVGLLGTVMGMIKSFQALAASGSPDSTELSTGISEALVNTAFGIATGAFAVISYNFFTNKIDNLTYAIDEIGFSIVATFAATHEG